MPMPDEALPGAEVQTEGQRHRSRWLLRGTCVVLLLVAAMAPSVWLGSCLTKCGTDGSGNRTQAAGNLSGVVGLMDEGTERLRPASGGPGRGPAEGSGRLAPAAPGDPARVQAASCIWHWQQHLVREGQAGAVPQDRAGAAATQGACIAMPEGGFTRQH